MGAGQGDYPRIIVAPTDIPDCFKTVPKLFNLVDKFQCPGIVISDLLLSEGRSSVDPAELDFNVPIDRGEVIGLNGSYRPSMAAIIVISSRITVSLPGRCQGQRDTRMSWRPMNMTRMAC